VKSVKPQKDQIVYETKGVFCLGCGITMFNFFREIHFDIEYPDTRPNGDPGWSNGIRYTLISTGEEND
jgi:hypothetical protein